VKSIIKVLEKNAIVIDQFSITKFHELYMERLNSMKIEMNYATELETIKKHLIISKENEDQCINMLMNLINKDKNKRLEEIALEYKNLDNMMNEDEEDMELDDKNLNNDEDE